SLILNEKSYSANEYFRSVATGNWNSIATWQMSTNGSTWFAATSTPTDTSGPITIQNPNTVTVTVNVNADQLIVNAGGTISIDNLIVLTIKDGSGIDLILNSGGTISGSGILQTQGAGVIVINRNGSNFTAAFKVDSGVTTSYDDGGPYIAIYRGSMTIDSGTTLNTIVGGYSNQGNSVVTNNGTISGTRFIMRGPSLINNSSIAPATLQFDSTTSLSGTGTYTSPAILIGGIGNVSLSNNVTFSPTSSFTINSGGILNPNVRTFTINSGTFYLNNGATVFNSGTFQTQGTVTNIIRNGSNFNAPLKVNTGTTTSNDDGGPYIAIYKGAMTIDAGATLTTQVGGYSNRANSTLTNNGTIAGNNFIMRGSTLTNFGSIAPTNLSFDSTTSVFGGGSYTSNSITIEGTGRVTLSSTITFSPVSNLTINSGGILIPNSEIFTFTSGSFILNSGATVSGSGASAGTLQTQGNVSFIFRNGSTFNSALNVNTGILKAYNDGGPYLAIYYGTIFVNSGATFTVPTGGYNTQANNSVINNGTISGNATFTIRGSSLANNGSIVPTNFRFDSTTSISGAGTYTSNTITIGGTGNVSLLNNVTFSPVSSFTISSGGILNPNTKIFNYNTATFYANGGSTVFNSGTFQTQSNVNLIIRAGANFNCPLKINTGTATSYDENGPYVAVYKGVITVDAGAKLQTPNGGYTIQSNNSVVNNGTIHTNSGAIFRMRGSVFTNNSSITGNSFSFDSTTALAGTGTNTSTTIGIGGTGNVSLSNNLTFSPGNTFSINSNGVLNPNSRIFTLASGSLSLISGATVQNSGTFQTQGTVNLITRSGSNFNAPLKVNTGTATCYDENGPYIGTLNGTVTIDTGATLRSNNGGYTLICNNNITNNGTLTGFGSQLFRFFGSSLINNGSISNLNFNFESGVHSLQGTGSWQTNANVLNGSTVNLTSNHQMHSVTVNTGGTFNLSSFRLLLKASNPISNSGTFNTTTGTVEYNGTSNQNISTTNITYNRLRINNSAGTTLIGATAVNDTLSVILGDLNLNGFILTISPTGYLTETAGNTVYGTSGYITTTRTLNAPSSLNVGGLGAILTTTVNLGSTEIRRGHAVQNGLSGNTSILRYFDITPVTNSGLNGTLVYKYDDSELNGKVEASLSLFRSTNTGSTWTAEGGTLNTANNTITRSGINAFSRWSASGPNAVASQIKVIVEGFYNVVSGKLNMRDTVRAYLRNNLSPFNIIDSAKSIIDSVTFTGSFLFANAPSGTYYIQIKHRNSIETWSKANGEVYTLGIQFNYDFTTAASQAYGSNMIQKGTKFCIFGGDVLQDGIVELADNTLIDNDAFNFATGYVNTDVTGDRFVDLEDGTIADNNAFNFVSAVTPLTSPRRLVK
ncbi:MAG: hypothetical protein ABI840_04390, partial [bacterium]